MREQDELMSSASAQRGGVAVVGGRGKSKFRSSRSRSRLDAMDERGEDESERRDETEELADGVNALEIKENFVRIVGVALSGPSARATIVFGCSVPLSASVSLFLDERSTVRKALNKLRDGETCAYSSYFYIWYSCSR